MNIEIILIVCIIILGLPFLGYDLKLLLLGLMIFLLAFPEQREKIWNSKIVKETYQSIQESQQGASSREEIVLIKEGNVLIKNLGKIKFSKRLKGQLVSIKLTWKNYSSLAKSLREQKTLVAYPHHHYETLKDLRKTLLNHLSSLIVGSTPGSVKERTLLKDRTLAQDEKVRQLIRRFEYVLDRIMRLLEKEINEEWKKNPYLEINPVQWTGPQPYDKDDHETIL